MGLKNMVEGLLLDLREEFEEEWSDLRESLGSQTNRVRGAWRRFSKEGWRELAARWRWLLPRTPAQWTVLLVNWALLLLVMLLWAGHSLGQAAPLFMAGTSATLIILYAYFYDVAWRRPIQLERPPRPPFMPIHKRKWLGRAVRLRSRIDLLWMAIRNEFTGEVIILGPYCPHCRPRQKLLAGEGWRLLGLSWFGRLSRYRWSCPRCGQSYPRPAQDEEEIVERIRKELEEEEW